MNIDIKVLKSLVEKDFNHKEVVSFNYPKYRDIGTPHDVWFKAVSKVEEYLDSLMKSQPFPEDYPIAFIRTEEKDESGQVIKVNMEILGKTTLVKFALQMLSPAEQQYVATNMLSSDKKDELIDAAKKLAGAEVISVKDAKNPSKEIMQHLKAKGIDAKNVKILSTEPIDLTQDATMQEEETDKELDALLSLPFMMPKSDDFN